MDDAVRIQRVVKARAILTNKHFKNRSTEEKRRIVRVMLDKGLLPEDLQMLKAELFPQSKQLSVQKSIQQPTQQLVGSNGLLTLDKLVISKILLKMKPRDVLSTCRVDKKYALVCNDPQIFHLLIEAHYPDSVLTNNPHRQYVALTSGVETTYFVDYKNAGSIEQTDPVQVGEPNVPENDPSWSSRNIGAAGISNFLNRTPISLLLDPLDLREIRAAETKVKDYERNSFGKPKMQAEAAKIRGTFFNLVDMTFKNFMKKYRLLGLEEVVKTSPIDFTKYAAAVYVGQDFGEELKDFLYAGRLYEGLGRRVRNDRIFLDVPGLPIPPGTKLWGLLHLKHPQRELKIFKNKEKLLTYVVENLYSDILRIIFGQFGRSIVFQHGDADALTDRFFNASDEEKLQMPEFQEWFSRYYPRFGLPYPDKQGLRNHLSVPNTAYRGEMVPSIGDYYLIELHF